MTYNCDDSPPVIMKPGRNDPCPCGSGKKFKQCCQSRPAPVGGGGAHDAAAIASSIGAALEHHRAGRLPEAEALYQQVLQSDPNHPDALHYLGAIASSEGRHEDAAALIARAIRAKPSRSMHYNLGNALQALGRPGEAAECYRQALALDPGYAEAHANLGNVLLALGEPDAAVESYRKALALKPDSAETHYNLGNALKALGEPDAAAECYRRSFALRPDHAEAHASLGNVLQAQGKLDEAVESYRRAIAFRPDYAEANICLGNVLQMQGRAEAAIELYRKALLLKPNHMETHFNLGNALFELGKLDAAIESYRNTLALKPDHIEAHSQAGAAFLNLGNPESAVEYFRKALALKPDYAKAHFGLGNALHVQGKLDETINCYQKALALKPDYEDAYGTMLFAHAYHATLGPEEYLSLARGWEIACVPAQERQAACSKTFRRTPLAGRRLKVGYVSGDFRQHAVSYFVEQLFAAHDRARVELFAYSNHSRRDAVTVRLQSLADHWVHASGTPDTALLERIEADDIDVLVDLSGHTGHNRMGVFARRAAPVQAHYLGYMASTGLTEMGYWIGDETLTPPETDSHFSERVWRLPRVWVSYDGKAEAPSPGWQPDQSGTAWIGSFNNLAKLTPATLALWARVLHALPEARLLLKTKDLADPGNRRRILDAMAGHGIAPERIELRDSSATQGWAEHMAYYGRMDISLDPVGATGGGTTTCDALWMGVPVITLEGDRMASRMTVSMLNSIGRLEWVARSEAEYVEKAVALARDVEQRKALRLNLRDRMAASPLCDARGLAASLENAYFEMFERWRNNKTSGSPSNS